MSPMNSERPISEYRCGQSDLYTVCETIAGTYNQYSADFINYSGTYTANTGTDLLSAVASARMLPDESQRKAEHAVLRKGLDDSRIKCLILWMQLNSFIRDGFSAEVYSDMNNAAGHPYYETAQRGNWDAARSLMDAATTFVAAHTAELTGGGMPAGFDATLTAMRDDLAMRHNEFLQAEEAARIGTDDKVNANNKAYRMTMKICEDGKRIFRNNAAIRQEFTFDKVLELVRNVQSGHGIYGLTTDAGTSLPLGQVAMQLDRLLADGTYEPVATVLSTNDGEYKFNGIVKGDYRLTASKEGYVAEASMVKVEGGPVEVSFALSAEV